MLVQIQRCMQGILKGKVRGFRMASWGGHNAPGTIQPGYFRRACCGVALFQYSIGPDRVQLFVESRGWPHEVVFQISPAKISQVKGRKLFSQSLRTGQLRTCIKPPLQFLPLFPVVILTEHIVPEQLSLILVVVLFFLVFS